MEHSPHNILVGAGAREYARQNQFKLEKNDALLVPETKKAYKVQYVKHIYLVGYILCDLVPRFGFARSVFAKLHGEVAVGTGGIALKPS